MRPSNISMSKQAVLRRGNQYKEIGHKTEETQPDIFIDSEKLILSVCSRWRGGWGVRTAHWATRRDRWSEMMGRKRRVYGSAGKGETDGDSAKVQKTASWEREMLVEDEE